MQNYKSAMAIAIVGLFIGAGAIPVFANNIISLKTRDEIDQQQTEDLGGGKPFYQKYWLAQGFTPTKSILTKVEVRLFVKGNHPSDAIIELKVRSLLDGDDLTTCSIDGSTVESGSWIVFDFPDIIVNPGDLYYMVLRSSSGDQQHHYVWYFDINDPYPSGDAWGSSNYGSSWYILDYPENDLPEYDFVFKTYGRENEAPDKPLLSGPTSGKTGSSYEYSAYAVDPDSDNVYFLFDWGDGTQTEWVGPVESGEVVKQHHVWLDKGNYVVTVKAKDEYGAESQTTTLSVEMPKYREIIDFLLSNWQSRINSSMLKTLLELSWR